MPEAMIILMLSMLKRREVTLENNEGVLFSGIVTTIQAEDGSGTGFNITMHNGFGCYLKRPEGAGTMKNPIRTNRNVECFS